MEIKKQETARADPSTVPPLRPPKVKICGITSLDDALRAVDAGADHLGFIFAPSPRQVNATTAAQITSRIPSGIITVGVFVDSPIATVWRTLQDAGLQIAQLHGSEPASAVQQLPPGRAWKAFRIRQESDLDAVAPFLPWIGAILLDAYSPGYAGGSGQSFDWRLAENASRFGVPIVLAGGLNPENVVAAIRQVGPNIVDVSSGVEQSPGKKDEAGLRAFIQAARTALDSVV